MKKYFIQIFLSLILLLPVSPARADLFGADVAVLTQILVQSIQTVIQLKSILDNGQDALNLARDLNAGIRSGLDLIRIINPKFNPGVYGDLRDSQNVLRAIEAIYGATPEGADQDLIRSQDMSVAEVISMNRNLYDYADQVDRERERILYHSQVVSPQGSAKLQNQSLAVLIGVMTQLLRTQSQMLKIMAQNTALETRKEKLLTQEFKQNYQGLSEGFKTLPSNLKLPNLSGQRGGL
ncbi:MAG: hypothetical protein JNL11_14950 [Bdellovibrionaceae bacterium]|nr:hypothetical protein [Pseudobdellovibrionaceae bacterium]